MGPNFLMNVGFYSEVVLIGTWYVYLETAPPASIAWMYYAACGAFVIFLIGFYWAALTGRLAPPKDDSEDE